MPDILNTVAHRPFPKAPGPWRLAQRWNHLLFAHWPIHAKDLAPLLPAGLEPDLFDGFAWVGVVPFAMDRVRTRVLGDIALSAPGASAFPELNLRTYVRSRRTGLAGVFFFSLDCANPPAVVTARLLFHLPYYLASMTCTVTPEGVEYSSTRVLARPVRFEATYRPTGPQLPASHPGTLEHFLTERYTLFTHHAGRLLAGHIHHLPWPLQPAEAEIRANQLPEAHGITLPRRPPILHFSNSLEVFIWPLTTDTPAP